MARKSPPVVNMGTDWGKFSITVRNDSLRATAISAGFLGFDSPRVDIDFLRVDIASAADLPHRGGNRRFRAAVVLLSHGGSGQERVMSATASRYLIAMTFLQQSTRKWELADYSSGCIDLHQRGVRMPHF